MEDLSSDVVLDRVNTRIIINTEMHEPVDILNCGKETDTHTSHMVK